MTRRRHRSLDVIRDEIDTLKARIARKRGRHEGTGVDDARLRDLVREQLAAEIRARRAA